MAGKHRGKRAHPMNASDSLVVDRNVGFRFGGHFAAVDDAFLEYPFLLGNHFFGKMDIDVAQRHVRIFIGEHFAAELLRNIIQRFALDELRGFFLGPAAFPLVYFDRNFAAFDMSFVRDGNQLLSL